MTDTSKIRAGMEVVGSLHGYVGKVDAIDGNAIRLAHEDPGPDSEYHFIPLDWVASVDEAVHLNRPYDDAMHEWKTGPKSTGS